jgi:hypothetical protein
MNDFKKILNEIIYFRQLPSSSTTDFKKLKHNSDLCPTFEKKLNALLGSFERYRNKVHDIQGIHDKGTDIFLRKNTDTGTEFICIQVKSQDDLNNKDYLKDLKSQYFDSQRTYVKMIDYYILLCCDTTDEKFKNKVRNIAQTFSDNKDVHVVEPEFSFSFFLLSTIQIDAIVKNVLGNEDIVIKETKKLFAEHTPTEIALLIYFCFEKLLSEELSINDVEDLLNIQFLGEIIKNTENHARDWFFFDDNELESDELEYFRKKQMNLDLTDLERINNDLSYLDNYIFKNDDGFYAIDQDQLYPLMAVILDGRVRYGYEGNELLNYTFELSKPLKGFSID